MRLKSLRGAQYLFLDIFNQNEFGEEKVLGSVILYVNRRETSNLIGIVFVFPGFYSWTTLYKTDYFN